MSDRFGPSGSGPLPGTVCATEFGWAYADFYFGTGFSKRTPFLRQLWLSRDFSGSVSASGGDYKHFRKVQEALKAGELSSKRPPGTMEQLKRIEHYMFLAFLHFQNQPLYVGKLPSRQDVWDRAKKLWASMNLWGTKDGLFGRHIDQLSKTEEQELKEAIKNLPLAGLNITRVFKKTGLLSLGGSVTR